MDPWKPKYKPLCDMIERAAGVAVVIAAEAAFLALVIMTL